MNQFSIRRFLLLLRKYLKENGKPQLLYFVAGMSFLFVVYGASIVSSFHDAFPTNLRDVYYIIPLIFGGTFYTGNFYNFLGNQPKGIQFLQLPAIPIEKVLVGFVLTQVGFFILFNAAFFCIDWFMCTLYDNYVAIPSETPIYHRHLFHSTPFKLLETHILEMIVVYFVCSAAEHFGSLAFKKNAYAKTTILIFILGAALIMINNAMLVSIIPEQIMPKGKFINESFRLGPKTATTGIVKLPAPWKSSALVFLPLFMYICFWTASFFKLKEKQL